MNDFFLSQEEIDALLPPRSSDSTQNYSQRQLDRILDLPMQLSVKLGETEKTLGEVLDLTTGSIVEFEREVSNPVDICLGGKVIARGEVVIVEEHFGVRITEIISPTERAQQMGGSEG